MSDKIGRTICQSGIEGWQARLQDNYDNDFNQWRACSETYGLSERLGYDSVEEAWEANPIVEGSTNPSDFRVSPIQAIAN